MDLSLQAFIDSLGADAGVAFAIELPNGARYRTGRGEPVFTVVFRTDAALMAASRAATWDCWKPISAKRSTS